MGGGGRERERGESERDQSEVCSSRSLCRHMRRLSCAGGICVCTQAQQWVRRERERGGREKKEERRGKKKSAIDH